MEKQNITTKDILKYSQELTILYVEDEEDAMESMSSIFKRLFKECYFGRNGMEGLDLFVEHRPDLIVTDIQMPVLDGLGMSSRIKEINPEQNVIIISAYSGSEYFLNGIKMGLDGYIIKPVQTSQLYEALYKSAKNITNEKSAEFYTEHLEQRVEEEVNKNIKNTRETLQMLSSVIEGYPNPVVTFGNDKNIHLSNLSFCKLFGIASCESINGKSFNIDEKILEIEGYRSSLKELDENNPVDNIISIKTHNGRKIFKVIVNDIKMQNGAVEKMYTFNDITTEEYQKQKIKSYSESLEDFIFYKRKQRESSTPATKKEESLPDKPAVIEDTQPGGSKRALDMDEQQALRRSHTAKITAQEYAATLDSYIKGELDELEEIETEIKDLLYDLEDSVEPQTIQKLGSRFLKYSSTVSLMFEFEDLAFALKGVSNVINTLNSEETDAEKLKKIIIIIRSIIDDLSNWRDTIFVSSASQDIHYLDSSLFSSCLQLEMTIAGSDIDDSENDLDLF